MISIPKVALHRHLLNYFYKLSGLLFLLLARVKYQIEGYATPRTFSMTSFATAADYDIAVVDHWLAYLQSYIAESPHLGGKTILELGPGADLGVGLYLLSKGAARYEAIDVNNLALSAPPGFYDVLLQRFLQFDSTADVASLREQVLPTPNHLDGRLKYVCDEAFRIDMCFDANSVDIVFSQAAFEHFTDMAVVVSRLSKVVKRGAVLVAEIDLKTHSRWIRDKDPNNIYRYSDWTYGLFHFPSAPNRLRPRDYTTLFDRYGWTRICVFPEQMLSESKNRMTQAYLNPRYGGDNSEMRVLTCVLCATKA